MSKLQIYKASAGAGKTFRLTIEYIKIALSSRYAYKNILAVTFTKKATNEMKERVLHELYKLSKGEKSAYLDVLKDELKMTDFVIQQEAKNVLKHLLHDYSRFSISTIDSFFQRVIKAFNRELGINSNFQVELDDERLISEATDLVMLSDNKRIFSWLERFALELIKEGKNWDIQPEILKLAKEINNEELTIYGEELFSKLGDEKFSGEYLNKLKKICAEFDNFIKKIGIEALNIIKNSELSISDFSYGSKGAAGAFEKMINGDFAPKASRVLSAIDTPSSMHKKTDKGIIIEIVNDLSQMLNKAKNYYIENYANYTSSKLIIKQFYTLGILSDINQKLSEINKERNITLLAQSNKLLQKIIDNSDTPFIYEKTGVYYKHFMIDEFQDTSGLQWNNFRPLLSNSLSEGNFGMLVGDIKQAIYRWRGGDWTLLSHKVYNDFRNEGTQDNILNMNWRSTGNIIKFNNTIFKLAPAVLQEKLNENLDNAGAKNDELRKLITDIYSNGLQEIGNKETSNDGYINIQFSDNTDKFSSEELKEQAIFAMIESIKDAQDRGIKAKDIAILVRKKKEAKLIANYLLAENGKKNNKYNFSVLSNESLMVKNAPSVSFLISLLKILRNREDIINKSYANYQYYRIIEPEQNRLGKQTDWSTDSDENKQLSLDFTPNTTTEKNKRFENINSEENNLLQFLNSEYFNNALASRNIQEIIFKLCNRFCLFSFKDELAYIQAFIDMVSKHQKNRISDLNSFLDWWDDKGKDQTISVSESLDAIRILTIHKAKGLEYDCVFIPFCDWDILPHSSKYPIIWCKTKDTPFSDLPIVPIKYDTTEMPLSIFQKDYFNEILSLYIEAINTLYVGFTRAKYELHTWAYTKDLTIGSVLKLAIDNNKNIKSSENEELYLKLNKYFCEEKNSVEIGEKKKFNKKETIDTSLSINQFTFKDFDNYLRLRKNHENFFNTTGKHNESINKGKIIHEILALIETKDQLPMAIAKLNIKGMINSLQIEEYSNILNKMLNDADVKGWFDGSYKVLNERSIFLGANGIKRPDRIMINNNEVIIVDYKSGELELGKHTNQVKTYINTLKNCGYNNVYGYLWYTKTNKRVIIN